jgi:hypothetical protein
MPPRPPATWPAAASYDYLEGAEPADFAWEWLRRDPGYHRRAQDACPDNGPSVTMPPALADCTRRWGCLNLPDPGLAWMDARILWSAEVDPSVLRVLALPVSGRDGAAFELARCGSPTVVRGKACEHVLLRAGTTSVRLDVASGSLLDGPVSLVHDLAGTGDIDRTTAALRNFLEFSQAGALATRSATSAQRLRRQVEALRTFDALADGASIRDIGTILFGPDRVRQEWAGEALKSRCRRVIARARLMASGGYRLLLW